MSPRKIVEPLFKPLPPPCDLRALLKLKGSPFRGPQREAMIERLKVIYSGEFDPSREEKDFWRDGPDAIFKKNPFLRIRGGAFWIRTKNVLRGGIERLYPNAHQEPIIQHFEDCWEKQTCPEVATPKVRQNGISTIGMAIMFACVLVYPNSNGHITANLDPTAKHLLKIQQFMWEKIADWDRPRYDVEAGGRKNDDEYAIEDAVMGVVGVKVRKDSAEKRDKIALGFTIQWRHRSEVGAYEAPEMVYGSIQHAEVKSFPSYTLHESQGYNKQGLFGQIYFAIKNHPQQGQFAIMFPWQTHAEYTKPLPPGMTEEDFWAGHCDVWRGEDRVKMTEKFRAFKCDAQQAHYYLTEKQKARRNRTLAVFPVHMPFDEDECFLSAESDVFDSDRMALDKKAVEDDLQMTSLATFALEKTQTPARQPKGWRPKYVRCNLVTDELNGFQKPSWEDAEFGGEYYVYELPRKGHGYAGASDLATGKQRIKNDRDTRDENANGIIRWTYDQRLDKAVMLVAVVFVGELDATELAKHAYALSILYPQMDGVTACPLNFERNNQGQHYVETIKRAGDGRESWYYSQRTGDVREDFQYIGMQVTMGGISAEASKFRLVTNMSDIYEKGGLVIRSEIILDQMGHYQKMPNGAFEGVGSKDDGVSLTYLLVECAMYANPARIVGAYPVEADGGTEKPVPTEEDPFAGMTPEERDAELDRRFRLQLAEVCVSGAGTDWWQGEEGQSGGDV